MYLTFYYFITVYWEHLFILSSIPEYYNLLFIVVVATNE